MQARVFPFRKKLAGG